MGAYKDMDEVIETVWKTARAMAPELPETYAEAEKPMLPGGIYEADFLGKVLLLMSSGDRCAVLSADCTMNIVDADDLFYTGKTAPLEEMTREYLSDAKKKPEPVESLLDELNGKQKKKSSGIAVRDTTTGLKYDSISQWARDNDLSPQSGCRLLRKEYESIKGHGLEYSA